MTDATIRLGVAGLGRAFMLMLPTLRADRRIRLVAATDPRPEALRHFQAEFQGRAYATHDALCRDPEIDAVYVASPHQFHAEHVVAAALHGKHALVEKPMALTLAECQTMIDAARRAGTMLIVGHSHSFDAPVVHARRLISDGTFGNVRMIHALNYTDFLYRPRRPEELDTEQGGGVVFSQGAHQVDIVRLLGGGNVRSVRAHTGAWDASRPTEGAYSALLTFDGGAFATLTYSGYAHYDSDELCGWIGELGHRKDPSQYGTARASLRTVATTGQEVALKNQRTYGVANEPARKAEGHNQFGMIVASCDRADLRPLPHGVMVYGDERAWLEALPVPAIARIEVIDELYAAIVENRPPIHDGEWARGTLEVCLAILESSRTGREVELRHQSARRRAC